MSLIIISEPKNKNGKYELTEAKLRGLIQEAYDKGYRVGQAKPKYELQPYIAYPGNSGTGTGVEKQPSINDPFWYERKPTPWWGEVTCETAPEAKYVPGITTTGTQGSDSTSGGFKGNAETTLLNGRYDAETVNCLHKTELFGGCSCCNIKGEEEKPT
jgi:hypothetical protein